MKHTPRIGAFVLESLTTGMYTNPFDCIREYIQNSSDAILNAEHTKVISQNKGIIEVTINPGNRSLVIRDNGVGVSASEVASRLLNIGMSNKIYGQEAGFRGIGRLAGIAYCKYLHFISTAYQEDELSMITFDCDGIRASITPSLKRVADKQVEELSDVIQKNTSQDLKEAKKTDHYFEVQMEGIDPSMLKLLDANQIEHYLSQVAPVEYDSQKFIFAPKIEQWVKDHGFAIPYVKLVLKTPIGERQLFKPYRSRYRTKKNDYAFDVKDIAFFPEDADEKSPFWMWYAKTDLLGMLDDDRVAGLRFRRNNIAIGGAERFSELFPGNEGRLNLWTMGEIHVLTQEIIPNARRDGFESTAGWESLCVAIDPFIKAHCKSCHDAASDKNRPTVKIKSSAESVIDEAKIATKLGLSSREKQKELVVRLDKEIERVSKGIETRNTNNEKIELNSLLTSLEAVKSNIENKDEPFTIQKLKSNLDRKQRAILKDVLSMIDNSFEKIECAKRKNCLDTLKKAILAKYQSSD